jgi:Family of unknown function (DUF5518)
MVNWKAVVVGIILAIILGILFAMLMGPLYGFWGMLIGIIIAGIVVGYMVNQDAMNGLVHGAIAGIIGGIIIAIIGLTYASWLSSIAPIYAAYVGMASIYLIIYWLIFGAIGGAIGALIKGKPTEEVEAAPAAAPVEEEREAPEIEFNLENVQKCLCPTCPVQGESQCAKDKLEALQKIMESEETDKKPTPEDVPGLYCSTGKANCTDLDTNKDCQCPNCPIWSDNDLASGEPQGVFCRDGKAK